MLYAARLGVEFWADALIHATSLYNRTYHSAVKMTPFEAYTGRVPVLDNLITFGSKITLKKLGEQQTMFHIWSYDGIFLGYQNTLHNMRYWDGYISTTKMATHDSQDEIQYSDNPANSSPASEHLMKVFTGDLTKRTDFSPEPIELKLKDVQPQSPDDVLEENLNTREASNLKKRKQRRNLIRKIRRSIDKVKRQKFQRPELEHLMYELKNVDISTNTYIQTTSQLIPIDDKIYHPILGIIRTPHPDIRKAEELVEFQLGSNAN